MTNKPIKVAIIRKVNNLENDDRIRKEVTTLTRLFPNVSFKVFVMLDDKNEESEGVTSYGLLYRTVYLKTRDKYPGGSHLMLKSWDYYRTIKKDITDYDFVWNSGNEPTPTLLFIRGKKLIWDLRELPLFLMGNPLKNRVLKYLFNKCVLLMHANQYRIDYLKDQGLITTPSKHVPIRNFPEFNAVETDYDTRYYEVKEWIGGRPCVYLQGLNNDSRAAIESVSAVMDTPGLCAIVLGRFYNNALEILKQKYGEEPIQNRICFAGNFKVLKIPQYMALCKLSLVFYKNTSPNNWLCEANRLYQAIDAGLPVVVGANPPMKSIVEGLNVGISVDTDGVDTDKIANGIATLLRSFDNYKKSIEDLKDDIKWDSQTLLLKNTFEKFFN